MNFRKNYFHTMIIFKLILLSFIFSTTSLPALNLQKSNFEKFTQFEVHADIVVLKSHNESKHFKRLPFTGDVNLAETSDLIISGTNQNHSFFHVINLPVSTIYSSSLARAPPIA